MLADPFHIIAHRGASAYAPENTMAAFRKAAEMGAPEVETDVGFTVDRALILFHDRTLDRTTSGTGLPSEYTLEELKRLDAGSWMNPNEVPDFHWDQDYTGEKLITLDELFQAFGDTFTYHVELKDRAEGLVPAVIDSIRNHRLVDKCYIAISRDEQYLAEAKRLEPAIRTALSVSSMINEQGAEAFDRVAKAGHDMVTLNARNQSRKWVETAHALGLEARSSGIRTRDDMVEAVEIGCNGMTINWPDWLLDYVADLPAD